MTKSKYYTLLATLLSLTLFGCGSSTVPVVTNQATYELTITNLTSGQPLTPVAAVLHSPAYRGFTPGIPATVGLEMLAESGSNTQFIADAAADAAVLTTASGAGLIQPGASEVITVTVNDSPSVELTIAAMLAATNDGFVGTSGFSLANIAIGSLKSVFLNVYDAGTESNSETAATVPALGGTAFDAVRDDPNNFVTIHRGVITADDGLVSSGLNQSHRFDNPAAKISIRRIS